MAEPRSASSARSIAKQYAAAFATGDPVRVLACVTDDFVNEQTGLLGTGCVGKPAYRERLPRFLAEMEDLSYDIVDLAVADTDVAGTQTVVVRYNMAAAYRGRDRFELPGVWWLEVRDGLIARREDYWDSASFLDQVGER